MSNPGGPIIIPLTDFAENGLTALFEATSQTQFNQAFDAFFSQSVEITVNGHHVSRENYKERFYSVTADEVSANVVFAKAVSVPKDPKNPIAAGTVGLFYTATVKQPSSESTATSKLEKINNITSSLNIVVIQDKSVTQPNGDTSVAAARRVSVLNEVVVNSTSTLLPVPNA